MDRTDAGQQLANALADYHGRRDLLVLALPRGGVPVGYEVARALDAPLDVVVTRKIGAPDQPEYAIGAVAETGAVVLDEAEIRRLGISDDYLRRTIAAQKAAIEKRVQVFRSGRPLPSLRGKTVIVVDDGIATGYTVSAALEAISTSEPQELILAVPVAPPEAIERLRHKVDRLICLESPALFFAVGTWYQNFEQVKDTEVLRLLISAKTERMAV